MGAKRDKPLMSRLVGLAAMLLAAAAVLKELRRPAAARTWHGHVLGVPYDFRRPTLQRVRERLWSPDSPNLVVPHLFGVGWTLNVGRLLRLLTRRGGEH